MSYRVDAMRVRRGLPAGRAFAAPSKGPVVTEIVDVYRVGAEINVARIDTEPGEGAICTLAIVTPAHIITVPRSDDPVVFSAERRLIVPAEE